jgi:hypothetical protein
VDYFLLPPSTNAIFSDPPVERNLAGRNGKLEMTSPMTIMQIPTGGLLESQRHLNA